MFSFRIMSLYFHVHMHKSSVVLDSAKCDEELGGLSGQQVGCEVYPACTSLSASLLCGRLCWEIKLTQHPPTPHLLFSLT